MAIGPSWEPRVRGHRRVMVMRPVQAPTRPKVGSGLSETEAAVGSGRFHSEVEVVDLATAMDSPQAVEVAGAEVEELESDRAEAARQPVRW